MAYKSLYKNIIFIEGDEPSAKVLGKIDYDKTSTFNSQCKSIDVVKEQLAEKTIAIGGNAVINFEYGQKSLGWFKSGISQLFCGDSVKWYGSGYAAILPQTLKDEIIATLNKK